MISGPYIGVEQIHAVQALAAVNAAFDATQGRFALAHGNERVEMAIAPPLAPVRPSEHPGAPDVGDVSSSCGVTLRRKKKPDIRNHAEVLVNKVIEDIFF